MRKAAHAEGPNGTSTSSGKAAENEEISTSRSDNDPDG